MGTFITLTILIGVIILIIKNMVKDKKNGKSIVCGSNCKDCHGACSK